MSRQSKCEQELSAVAEERNLWCKLALSQKEEIAQLKQQIDGFLAEARIRLDRNTEELINQEKLLARMAWENEQPHLVQVLAAISNISDETTVNNCNALADLLENGELPPDQVTWIKMQLAACLREVGARREWRGATLAAAYSYSGDPPLLCDAVCRQLRTREHVNIALLEKLGSQWIQDNLPEPPTSFTTLKTGLEEAHKAMSGPASSGRRSLTRYRNWFKVIEEHSKRLPPHIAELVQSKIDSQNHEEN